MHTLRFNPDQSPPRTPGEAGTFCSLPTTSRYSPPHISLTHNPSGVNLVSSHNNNPVLTPGVGMSGMSSIYGPSTSQLTSGNPHMYNNTPYTAVHYGSIPNTAQQPPTNVILYQLSDSAILFRWQPPLPPNNFFIDYLVLAENTNTGVVLENVLPQGASSNAIRGLQSGDNYNLGVYTNIEPITSVLADFTVVPLVGTAGNVTIGAVTARELVVLWMSQGIDAQSFVVRMFSEDGTQEYSQTVSAATSSAIFENLTPDTMYTTVVEAITTAGGSATVGSESATTNTLPDSTSVIVDSTTAASATLSWTAVPSATGYIISYISQDRSDTGTFVSSGSGTTATVPGLQPQTTYTFSVVGTDGTAVVNVGTAVGTTDILTDVYVDSVSTTTATLSWTPIAGSFFYRVFYTGPDGVEQSANPATAPTDTITGLTPGTMYTFRVEATDGGGQRVLGNVPATTGIRMFLRFELVQGRNKT
eukprot:XP_011681921.1 PREDICTED: collagen alpha-1(XIV) chain-like [Strongylocentrotus purpuratus]